MARSSSLQDDSRPPPRQRRAYFDCRYGQLHVHNAIPAGGGFDELTSVLCIHGKGQTGRVFQSLLGILGYQRSAYAPDLPGCGETDPAPGETVIDAAVNALVDFLDSMRIRSVDLLTLPGTGGAESREIAQRLVRLRGAGVRRVLELTAADLQSPELAGKVLAALGGGPLPT